MLIFSKRFSLFFHALRFVILFSFHLFSNDSFLFLHVLRYVSFHVFSCVSFRFVSFFFQIYTSTYLITGYTVWIMGGVPSKFESVLVRGVSMALKQKLYRGTRTRYARHAHFRKATYASYDLCFFLDHAFFL